MENPRFLLRATKYLAIFVLLLLAPLCFAECPRCFGDSVVVQVLANDGQPVPEQTVTFELRYKKLDYTMVKNQRTDSNGEARIQLPPAARPESLAVDVNFTPDDLHCSCRVHADTETVMLKGLTVDGRPRNVKLSAPVPSAPGRIIFVARPSTHWEKVLFGG